MEIDNRGLERPLEHMVKVFRHVKAHAAVYRAILLDADLSPFHPRFMALFHELGMRRMADVTGSARGSKELVERETILYATVGATMGVIL